MKVSSMPTTARGTKTAAHTSNRMSPEHQRAEMGDQDPPVLVLTNDDGIEAPEFRLCCARPRHSGIAGSSRLADRFRGVATR